MGRIKTEDLTKHTLNLRTGDMEAIGQLFPKFQSSVMVRRIVSKFVDQMRKVPEEPLEPLDDVSL